MIFPRQFANLAALFRQMKLDYAVLGGVAVAYYGEPRFTWDIDINILLRKDQIDTFLATAKKRGLVPRLSKAREKASKTGVIPMMFIDGDSEGHCDLTLAQNPLEIAGIRRARLKKIGSIKLKLITCEDLILHKIASDRPRDREDLLGILRRQQSHFDRDYIYGWLRRLSQAGDLDFMELFQSLEKQC